MKHRQTGTQLLCILFARTTDPRHFPSVDANALDSFYHENTDFDPAGPLASEMEQILTLCQKVTDRLKEKWYGKRKGPKLSLFALAFFFQDVRRNPNIKLDSLSITRLADYAAEVEIPVRTRTVSGPAVRTFYDSWVHGLPTNIGIRLDEKRLFDEHDKKAIWERDEGKCQACGGSVDKQTAEYDHFPTPYTLGGHTVVQNGRLVHDECHPRGLVLRRTG